MRNGRGTAEQARLDVLRNSARFFDLRLDRHRLQTSNPKTAHL
jgi:hypothetical protein